jgi:AraC family transcriptional activator of pobA
MKKEEHQPKRFDSISDLHRALGLPKPLHPLISLIDNTKIVIDKNELSSSFFFNFYQIALKKGPQGKIRYGQSYYDFDEGSLVFTAPNQIMSTTADSEYVGSTLLIHPDFIKDYPLGKKISTFGFFAYNANEALHLSEKERVVIAGILQHVEDELQNNIDEYSHDVLIAQIELLLSFANRFYKRQFITRTSANNDLLVKLETVFNQYFKEEMSLKRGLPTVQFLADQLNVSPHYLSDMLRTLTGKNAQQHIHQKLIDHAKTFLSTSSLSVAEIAYLLGFEHPQSFNKLFKRKTDLSPLEYRQSFN